MNHNKSINNPLLYYYSGGFFIVLAFGVPETENYGHEQEPCQRQLLNSGDISLSPLISDEK